MIKTLQPKARIIEASFGKVEVADILNTKCFDFDKTAASAGWAQIYDKDAEEEKEHHHGHHHHHHDHDEDHSHCDHEHGHCCHHHDDDDDGEEEYGIGSFVYRSRRPFSQDKLQEFVNSWPKSVVRAKGILWFDNARDDMYIFEQAGVQIMATESGKWLAAFPKKQQQMYLAQYPDMRERWDEKYGDREIKLVFIGRHMDKHAICEALDKCLSE